MLDLMEKNEKKNSASVDVLDSKAIVNDILSFNTRRVFEQENQIVQEDRVEEELEESVVLKRPREESEEEMNDEEEIDEEINESMNEKIYESMNEEEKIDDQMIKEEEMNEEIKETRNGEIKEETTINETSHMLIDHSENYIAWVGKQVASRISTKSGIIVIVSVVFDYRDGR